MALSHLSSSTGSSLLKPLISAASSPLTPPPRSPSRPPSPTPSTSLMSPLAPSRPPSTSEKPIYDTVNDDEFGDFMKDNDGLGYLDDVEEDD
ncbi:hypothetical protein ACLB2K_073421 [Fragaria x ananassa]